MNDDEFKERIAIYKQQHAVNISPHGCKDCNEYAEYHDTLAGEDYCNQCLEKSLVKDIDELIENTNGYILI